MTDPDGIGSQTAGRDFIRQIIDRDLAEGKVEGKVVTRFPPEPNGFLHIGHAKSILLNFGIAREYGGRCHLRFDDTNPITEEHVYAEAIKKDVRWLGFDWGEHLYHAADYFERMYEFAESLIRSGKAYVDSESEEEIREGRGTVTNPGRESGGRSRSVEENLDLFRRMRAGEFEDGAHVLRARIDMTSPNMLMRDPILYRIRHASHYRTGDEWCVYPLYDYAHCLEDAIEGITHSLCTLEFANNRELYDWILDEVGFEEPRPHQYEFGKGLLDYTVTSKRKLLQLVKDNHVEGWDDPRMPTLAAFRRRGVPPEAVIGFWTMVGVARADARIDIGRLEYAVRDELNRSAPRVLAVLDPLKVTITNWPAVESREIEAPYFPHDIPREGTRSLSFSRALLIERSDFAEDPPKGFRRLVPGGEVRLRHGCVIRCDEVVKDRTGRVLELRCTHDPETWDAAPPDGRKVGGTIHWLSAPHAVPCEVRLYDRLFSVADPESEAVARGGEGNFRDFLNPDSITVVGGAFVEPSVLGDDLDTRYQFERLGYFWRDPELGRRDRLVFNRIVTLRDTWAARAADGGAGKRAGMRKGELEGAESPELVAAAVAVKGGAGEPAPRGRAPRVSAAGAPAPPSPEVRERARLLVERFALEEVDAEILARDPALVAFFEGTVDGLAEGAAGSGRGGAGAASAANWIINSLPPLQAGRALADLPFGPAELAALIGLVEEGTVSRTGGHEILEVLAQEGGDPRAIVERLDVAQVSDAAVIRPVAAEVVAANPAKVREYREGKSGLIGFFMGQVMRRTGGKADPELARALLKELLE
ncbi:MAG: glutamine--tRNA ligase/YqeY domain fusion protein [Gemmatimonadota bacterium]